MSWTFETDCINSDGESINTMRRAAKQVTFRTLQRVLGLAFEEKQNELGYDIQHERGGLRMSQDWAVSYWRSKYKGHPCYYFVWSHIEYIFLDRGERKPS